MSAPARIEVRATSPADLDRVTRLLRERDGAEWASADVRAGLFGLEPAHLAGWLATVDGEPAGLTTLYIREQRWGEGGGAIRAGYWAHLFVREAMRRHMIYPQLVLAMMRGIRGLGIDAIFTGTRRAHVAEGHVKLGFAKLGELRVVFKPLRPFRLLARYKNWPGIVHAAALPGDAAYGAWLALRRRGRPAGVSIREIPTADAAMDGIVGLLNEAGAGRISQAWTAESVRRRMAGAIDGHGYTLLGAEGGGRLVGAALYRLAERDRVKAGVIMDLVTAPGENATGPALLAEAERRVRAAGADTTLVLDGAGPGVGGWLRASGHRTSDETYQMLVWPKTLVAAGSPAADLSNWRFAFLDHDAF